MQNSDFWTRITDLYGSQRSPVVLCMQYSVISNRNTFLYRYQPLSVVFAGKTASFGSEQQVSMGPRYPLSFCACKTSGLAPELLVPMGPSLHLWFLLAKQRLLDQHTSLYGFHFTHVVLCMQNGVISTGITSLYGSQPSPVVFRCITVSFGPEQLVSMGPRHHLSFCACKIS